MLAFGRISWEKGLDRLIAAMPLAPAARLVIAGDDAGGVAGHSGARRLGVADRVTILPRNISGADKEALLAGAALFAMTSLSENFGLAAFEAMRRGVPVLATPMSACRRSCADVGGHDRRSGAAGDRPRAEDDARRRGGTPRNGTRGM